MQRGDGVTVGRYRAKMLAGATRGRFLHRRNIMRQRSRWWVMAICLGIAVFLAAGPAAAQVKIRFQTWHWNEKPVFFALEEFQKEFNKNNPGIEVVRDDSRYGDKETVYIAQSQAKAAADIAHFLHRAVPLLADRGYLLDLTPFI